jgi:hypothetical protein
MKSAACLSIGAAIVLGWVTAALAFSNTSMNGTYALSGSVTLNDPTRLCGASSGSPGCGRVNNVSGSVALFFQTLALDLKASRCPSATPQLKALVGAIKNWKAQAGDEIYVTGTMATDGFGHFTGGFIMVNSSNSIAEALNFSNLGAGALICGGASEDGNCSSLCIPASLGCDTRGGYIVGTEGTGTATLYAYPVAGSLCGGRSTLTFAECCDDPALLIVFHEGLVLGDTNTAGTAASVRSVITDQGLVGGIEAKLQ